MKTAATSQSRVASASTRRQGFARSARRLTPPLTAAAAPAQSAISSCWTQLLRSSNQTDSAAKFLGDPAILNQRLFNPSVHAFGATSDSSALLVTGDTRGDGCIYEQSPRDGQRE